MSKRRARLRMLILLLACSALTTLTLDSQRPVTAALTTAAEVHALPGSLAARKIPVHLTVVVTYYQPAEHTLFVADRSGAVYIKTTHVYPIKRGDVVRVDGVTARSFRTTVGADPHMTIVGHTNLDLARNATPLSYPELMSGRWDCAYVRVRGIVRSAVLEQRGDGPVASLQVALPGGNLQVYVLHFEGLDLRGLLDSEVEITGIVGGDFNARWELIHSIVYAADLGEVHVLHPPSLPVDKIPLTGIEDVIPTRRVDDQSPRVRVRGLLTFYRPGNSAVIAADGRNLFVSTRQFTPIPLGSVVDATGFADDSGYGPSLQNAQIFATGQTGVLAPLPVSYPEAMSGIYADNLIRLRGSVLSQVHSEQADTLYLMVDNHAVSVVLQNTTPLTARPEGEPTRLKSIPMGAIVAVTGICRITPTSDWGTPGATPLLFRLDMRTVDDLQVIALPSWWTVTHLAVVVGALVTVSFVISLWAVALRRRVTQQTATIAQSMRIEKERSRLLEEINSTKPLPALLRDIQSTVESFVPGVQCFYELDPDRQDPAHMGTVSRHLPHELFRTDLTDTHGRHLGDYYVRSVEPRALTHLEAEVLGMGAGLVNLAVNQRRMYQELNYTSTHDQLTSLPNRRLSDRTLERAVQISAKVGGRMGVAYVDVNRFKDVNDQHGHRIGDIYLQQIAHRLAGAVRASDQLARIGGDEFLLISSTLSSVEDAEAYKRRLEDCFERPFNLDGIVVHGSASIGVAVFPDHGDDPEALKRHADIDMYTAKRLSHVEARHSHSALEYEILTASDIRSALQNGHFQLHYQPQFSAERKLRGLEALIRMNDPVLGMLMPDVFIRAAERSDVIHPLGRWVIRQALADGRRWGLHRGTGVRMVVNVSWRQVEQPTFPDEVAADLRDAGFPAHCLEIEITERTIARATEQARLHLERLRALGITISMDDFGTEHSCLSALHRMPVDTIKIDRSFVMDLTTSPDAAHVVRAIVQMAHSMRKRVVAEGVETEEAMHHLTAMGEMDFQGYLFSRPLPPEQVVQQLPDWFAGLSAARG